MGQLKTARECHSEEFFMVETASNAVIALVSSNRTFSERLCRVTEAELGEVEIRQCDTVEQLIESLSKWRERLQLVILDEASTGKLDMNLAGWIKSQSGACFACAYSDAKKTEKLFSGGLYPDPIASFFPLSLNLDAWISVLRLFLSGHVYVDPELYVRTRASGGDR